MTKTAKAGYRRPPVETQFQKGVSGNPSGRPKRGAPFFEVAKTILEQPVTTRTRGQLSMGAAVMRRMAAKALGGDARAMKRMIELIIDLHRLKAAGNEKQIADYAEVAELVWKHGRVDLAAVTPPPEGYVPRKREPSNG